MTDPVIVKDMVDINGRRATIFHDLDRGFFRIVMLENGEYVHSQDITGTVGDAEMIAENFVTKVTKPGVLFG